MKPTSIALHTLGCRLNQAETASIQYSLEKSGCSIVDMCEPADIVVINTCTVTENGDADTRRLVNKISRKNPQVRIALIGCQAQIQKEKLAELPNVRWVVGNSRKMELAEILMEDPDPIAPRVIAPTIERTPFTIPSAGFERGHTRANLKIQDGCDFFCSFCEIPYARGRARSRIFEDILKEAQVLVSAGHKEVVLTGINIGTYAYETKTLIDVILELEYIPGLERIRISSIEPTTIPDELLGLMTFPHKVCRHLHIPLQSGDDEILARMNRHYTREEFAAFVRKARKQIPEICVGSDCIVGFPGETDEHFKRTEEFLNDLPIDYVHVFSYSDRHLAKSRQMARAVSSNKIQQRSQILRELSQRRRMIFYSSLIGTTQKVLFEAGHGRKQSGLTDHFVRVEMDSVSHMHHQMELVRLGQIQGSSLQGTLV